MRDYIHHLIPDIKLELLLCFFLIENYFKKKSQGALRLSCELRLFLKGEKWLALVAHASLD